MLGRWCIVTVYQTLFAENKNKLKEVQSWTSLWVLFNPHNITLYLKVLFQKVFLNFCKTSKMIHPYISASLCVFRLARHWNGKVDKERKGKETSKRMEEP